MAGRRVRCNGCRMQLAVPPDAKTIRCALCLATTPVQPNDPLGRVHDRVRQAKTWFKDLLSNVSNLNSYSTPVNYTSAASMPSYGHLPMLQTLLYPSICGKKRALLCGISYRGRRNELKGTVNDVNCMKYLLCSKFDFSDDCILVLSEDEVHPLRIPTKKNIRMAMNWLVQGCQQGDSLVFHYSGHGARLLNYNGDELDGFDETICPLDYETEGIIIDDEINATVVRPLPEGVTLHAIIDACHSGTVLDLPFLCRMDRSGFYRWEDHSPPSGVYKGTSGGLAVSFSGCDDHQTSADTLALSGNTITGAMTFCFIQAVESEPGATYGRILNAMRTAIREAKTGIAISGPIASLVKRVFGVGLTQEPQLSSSEQFDIYRKPFVL
ncbi:hypothetical protein MRB53_033513 [Persea americana]|uniref:Uncharacterized protein n=1 Tax=Persea americana TaxID=3435 RepID=A0ACC2KVH4_PERAE|nr:hypothetical protein MRB53_033513 [Persea americana]